jgi:hypothetical protein
VRLLLVSALDREKQRAYSLDWRLHMRLLLISKLHPWARAVNTLVNYVKVGRRLGHEVALFGEQLSELPSVPFSLDVDRFDCAIFIVYEASDFPDLPYLARLLDGMPKERRIVIDCSGRYNETVRVEHDFNHLERLDGHQGWEWVEGFEAISDRILQPTPAPLRADVRPFLFHAYDPAAVARPFGSATEAAASWSKANDTKPYGVAYAGNNWQRWSQLAPFFETIAPLRERLGPTCLAGWDWDKRPDWAVEHGLAGVDVDWELLERTGVEARWATTYDEFIPFLSQARFSPIFQRPLYNHLRLVSNRMFETFCADTIPLLMLPEDLIDAVYGPAARRLAPGEDVAGLIEDALADPRPYWEAALETRRHLAREHSFEKRFAELLQVIEGGQTGAVRAGAGEAT